MLPVLLFCVPFSTLRLVHRTRFTVHRLVYFSDEARFRIPHGCDCDLLLVLGLEKPNFAIVPIGARFIVASARSREVTRAV